MAKNSFHFVFGVGSRQLFSEVGLVGSGNFVQINNRIFITETTSRSIISINPKAYTKSHYLVHHGDILVCSSVHEPVVPGRSCLNRIKCQN